MRHAVLPRSNPSQACRHRLRGAQVARRVCAGLIVGLGGGSPMDASKAIWAMYERARPDATEINPMITLGRAKAKLIAILTTGGTGSEATWALVLTDTEKRKFSTGSRELVPTRPSSTRR